MNSAFKTKREELETKYIKDNIYDNSDESVKIELTGISDTEVNTFITTLDEKKKFVDENFKHKKTEAQAAIDKVVISAYDVIQGKLNVPSITETEITTYENAFEKIKSAFGS
jgi:hypothetical protein